MCHIIQLNLYSYKITIKSKYLIYPVIGEIFINLSISFANTHLLRKVSYVEELHYGKKISNFGPREITFRSLLIRIWSKSAVSSLIHH